MTDTYAVTLVHRAMTLWTRYPVFWPSAAADDPPFVQEFYRALYTYSPDRNCAVDALDHLARSLLSAYAHTGTVDINEACSRAAQDKNAAASVHWGRLARARPPGASQRASLDIDARDVASRLGLGENQCPSCGATDDAMKFYAWRGKSWWKHHRCGASGPAEAMARIALGGNAAADAWLESQGLMQEVSTPPVGWPGEQEEDAESPEPAHAPPEAAWYSQGEIQKIWNACPAVSASSRVGAWLRDERKIPLESVTPHDVREAHRLPGARKGIASLLAACPAAVFPVRNLEGHIYNLQFRFVEPVDKVTRRFYNGGNPGSTEDAEGFPFLLGAPPVPLQDVAARADVLIVTEGAPDTLTVRSALRSGGRVATTGRGEVGAVVIGALNAGDVPKLLEVLPPEIWNTRAVLLIPHWDPLRGDADGTYRLGVRETEYLASALRGVGAAPHVWRWEILLKSVCPKFGILTLERSASLLEHADLNDVLCAAGMPALLDLIDVEVRQAQRAFLGREG